MKPPKKKQRTARPRAHKRKRTKNPLFTLINPPDFPIPAGTTIPVDIVGTPFGFDVDMERMAADLIVQLALAECLPAEKVLIAALIPEFLKVARPKKNPPPTEAP